MYIKLIYGNETTLYECHRVSTKTVVGTDRKSIVLTMKDGVGEDIEIEITDNMKVFVMNNEGKTIDKIRR